MVINLPLSSLAEKRTEPEALRRRAFVSAFREHPLRFRKAQKESLDWLAEAHTVLGGADARLIRTLIARYSASPDRIAFRSHELADFTHRRWNDMRLFSPKGSNATEKAAFFNETVSSVFDHLYPKESAPPEVIVHVTCTGYSAPSGAQELVSLRNWGQTTQVIHAYHMGCYAAHPALRIAAGQLVIPSHGQGPVDIVHTELCSLHFDPAKHEPAQLVIQSLFADGCIQYRVSPNAPACAASLEILALHDEILPDSLGAMNWAPGPFGFSMTLSKDVPAFFAGALPEFMQRLFEKVGLDFAEEKGHATFAVHPGGPRIIEMSEQALNLDPAQTAWSRHILREHGNMSSATLPHIWQKILEDPTIPNETLIASVGAGPGLTLSGALFRKKVQPATPPNTYTHNAI